MSPNSNPIKSRIPDARAMWAFQMKNLKASLPSSCTHLAPYKNSKGEYYVRVIIHDMEYLHNIPEGFIFKQADLDELRNQLLDKCEKGNVSK